MFMRVRTTFSGPGGPLISTFDFEGAGEIPTGTEATNAHIATATFWNSYRSFMVDDLSYVVSNVLDVINPLNGEITGRLVAANSAAATGSVATEAAPFQTQGLVRWVTNNFIAGREVTGSTFLPGIPEAFSVNGSPDASWVSGVQSAANALVAATPDLSVYSRTHHVVFGVEGGSARNSWKVLRSRR